MNRITEEIDLYFGCSTSQPNDEILEHYGVKRRSGRYPWGSGEDPYQSSRDFMGRVDEMRKKGFTYTDPETGKKYDGDTAIAKSLGLSTTDFRTSYAIAKDQRRTDLVNTARRLKEKEGLNPSEIGRKMGINESSVRSLLNSTSEAKTKQARDTANALKKIVDEKGMIDVGTGVERELRISKEKLDQALFILQAEHGYEVYSGRFDQVTNKGQKTTQKVLCPPGTEHKEIYNLDKVHTVNDYISRDGGTTIEKKFHYPESVDSKRVMIRYADEGGLERDGMVQIRPGVKDLSLGESRYAQVRIMVDGSRYIKGMAVYGDPKDFPPGVDIICNSNKGRDKSKLDCLKKIKDDPDNPFGALVKEGGQYWYDPKTGEHCSSSTPGAKLGCINKTREEGDWTKWKDSLPSQFLSKQPVELAKKQLDIAKASKEEEFAEIKSLTNPTVRKYYLNKFAQSCDSAAVHLKAAALPGQKYQVLLPLTSVSDKECYCPNYADGTKLALIRYPHGGTFEIPIVTVNNKNQEGQKMIGKLANDVIGINNRVAERLSGADFDGDAVMAIPLSSKVKIKSTPKLKELEGWDNKLEYGTVEKKGTDGKSHYYRNGVEIATMKKTDTEMGRISNLITDMTLLGADDHELARAVKHSMVVIDAEKHKLDYKASEKDNRISELMEKYQGRSRGGASTIISKASGEKDVLKRQGTPKVNQKGKPWYDPSKPEGSLIYKLADNLDYTITKVHKRTGEEYTVTKQHTQKTTKMGDTDDAYTLLSKRRHPMEVVYADYANSMKDLANKARLEMVNTGKVAYNKEAKKQYANEVQSLKDKLDKAEMNTVRERTANRMAAAEVSAKLNEAKEQGVKLKGKDIKKASQVALTKSREEVGSIARKDRNIHITDKEWEAIQKGAVSETTLKRILNNCDPDSLREKAMPKESLQLNNAKINRIKAMSASYTIAQIANALGVSTSTVSKYLKS